MIERIVPLWIALTIANFIFEALTRRQWWQAVDRSIFQGIALIVYTLVYPPM